MIALYQLLTRAVEPFIGLYLRRRLRAGKEHPERLPERLGHPSQPRPEGTLLWFHGASVGESLALLPLADAVAARTTGAQVLITSGTVTSAELVAPRLKEGWLHQFAPVDTPAAVTRFLDHWRPDLAVWVESELWPNLILTAARRNVPMALVNGRLSERSFRRWQQFPGTARRLLQSFRLISPQRAEDGIRFATLDAEGILGPFNLKLAGAPLPVDPAESERLRQAFGHRPVWLAVSTHEGEEAMILDVHRRLSAALPDVLTVIAPRHPERGDGIRAMLESAARLPVAQRSRREAVTAGTAVYLADTLGELGTLFTAAPVVFVGGSLVPAGGHNPLEPARAGCAVLHGPLVANFTDVYGAMEQAGAALRVADGPALAAALLPLLEAPAQAAAWGEAARRFAAQGASGLDALAGRLAALTGGAAS